MCSVTMCGEQTFGGTARYQIQGLSICIRFVTVDLILIKINIIDLTTFNNSIQLWWATTMALVWFIGTTAKINTNLLWQVPMCSIKGLYCLEKHYSYIVQIQVLLAVPTAHLYSILRLDLPSLWCYCNTTVAICSRAWQMNKEDCMSHYVT